MLIQNNMKTKEVKMGILMKAADKIWLMRFGCQKGQSTLEYAMVMVIAGIISAVLIAVGKPYIVDIISNAFEKISALV
jgi:Flp pilus assembly pilin Flp